jgi:putative oxidoreductase
MQGCVRCGGCDVAPQAGALQGGSRDRKIPDPPIVYGRSEPTSAVEDIPMTNATNDGFILAARLLLATLFLIFGWRKLKDQSGTVSQLVQLGVPMPAVAAGVATFMELPVAFAVGVGAFTRPASLLMLFYTLGTALIAHRYWTATGAGRIDAMDGFYKNLSIMGGFLLLFVTGAGKYSVDAWCNIVAR